MSPDAGNPDAARRGATRYLVTAELLRAAMDERLATAGAEYA